MQPLCTEKMKTARDLLDYGVLFEGAKELSGLRNCEHRADCRYQDACLRQVEGQWPALKPSDRVAHRTA
ncbi:MAG: hypothetical protein ACR2RE_32115 [Geminicoccaceae bacterium]